MAENGPGRFQEMWKGLTAGQKKGVVLTIIIIGGVLISLGIYYVKYSNKPAEAAPTIKAKKEINLDAHLLEKSAYLEGQRKIENYQKDLEELKKQFSDLKTGQGEAVKTLPGKAADPGQNSKQGASKPQAVTGPARVSTKEPLPPLPPPPSSTMGVSFPPPPVQDPKREEIKESGGIEIATNKFSGGNAKDKEAEKKNKKNSVYIPPSFMAATMLTGLDAPTMEGGKGQPVPVLLRIKDLAFLPNSVRANLKGCFAICEGHGNLADERAHLRVINIACLSKKGKTPESYVIDQKVTGFVVDTDGKVGLRGVVVSKMGAVIGRSFIAGLFAGVGEAINAQSSTVSISPLGQTQTIDANRTVQAGLGQGLASTSREISKFYLDLARQTLPVIEVGAVRDVTLVLQQGVEFEIKEINRK